MNGAEVAVGPRKNKETETNLRINVNGKPLVRRTTQPLEVVSISLSLLTLLTVLGIQY